MWRKAIQKELQHMEELKVWDLVQLHPVYRLVGTTWVFKLKKDKNGKIIEHMDHLWSQGCTQTPGVDYPRPMHPLADLIGLELSFLPWKA
ncbi:hypothetical protein O181_074662 [Austropuccinia psidii MF-1]|uniref:Reverse transcriptase Ty1/copia-type domain-containing protein n=1 Tax=Austropuccinia psidii MF-1 TaxID=1389203 RepID=A0A9Q3FDG6_9BASI|nr:hypothetical protein [Austropuccinia psidii MF-1]